MHQILKLQTKDVFFCGYMIPLWYENVYNQNFQLHAVSDNQRLNTSEAARATVITDSQKCLHPILL